MNKRVPYPTEAQAQTALDRINATYTPPKKYLENYGAEYNFWYIDVVTGFDHEFFDYELERSYEHTDNFSVKDNPTADKNFRIGETVFASTIDISGNLMTKAEVDAALTQFSANFNELTKPDKGVVILNIGANVCDTERANATPSMAVLNLVTPLVESGVAEITYWNGTENVKIPSLKKRILTSDSYELQEVKDVYRGFVSVDTNDNIFVMTKDVFKTFADLMEGERYWESDFKCCVIFGQDLEVREIFLREEKTQPIYVGDNYLAQAPYDFFMRLITSADLADPDPEIWNKTKDKYDLTKNSTFKVFPEINLDLLE